MTAMIPGAFESRPATPRQPGAIGGSGFGSPHISGAAPLIGSATTADRQHEGGAPRRTGGHSWLRRLINR